MFKLGIIGYPLGHSISSVIHNTAMKSIDVEGVYDVLVSISFLTSSMQIKHCSVITRIYTGLRWQFRLN